MKALVIALLALGWAGSAVQADEAADGEASLLGSWTGTRTARGAPDCPLVPHGLSVDRRSVEIVWVRGADGGVAAGEILDGELEEQVRWTVVEGDSGLRLQRVAQTVCLDQPHRDVALFEVERKAGGDGLVLRGETADCPALGCVFDVRYKLERAP
ncbi:MAG: hypothetical protein R2991_16455 [Thermoanaerobaculia bacterium]